MYGHTQRQTSRLFHMTVGWIGSGRSGAILNGSVALKGWGPSSILQCPACTAVSRRPPLGQALAGTRRSGNLCRPLARQGSPEASIFEGFFFVLAKKIEEKIWATKGGNDERRERRNEGTTGMILPRPYSKTWLIKLCEKKMMLNNKGLKILNFSTHLPPPKSPKKTSFNEKCTYLHHYKK